jgi:hypothetical protein
MKAVAIFYITIVLLGGGCAHHPKPGNIIPASGPSPAVDSWEGVFGAILLHWKKTYWSKSILVTPKFRMSPSATNDIERIKDAEKGFLDAAILREHRDMVLTNGTCKLRILTEFTKKGFGVSHGIIEDASLAFTDGAWRIATLKRTLIYDRENSDQPAENSFYKTDGP